MTLEEFERIANEQFTAGVVPICGSFWRYIGGTVCACAVGAVRAKEYAGTTGLGLPALSVVDDCSVSSIVDGFDGFPPGGGTNERLYECGKRLREKWKPKHWKEVLEELNNG